MRFGSMHPLVAGLLFSASVAAASPLATDPPVAVLGQIEAGQWQLHEPGSNDAPKQMCVADPASLIQLGHPGAQCTRLIIADAPRAATVHYTCPGAGNGRTTIKLESRSTLSVQTQGIAGGLPFDLSYEARRMGDCPTRH